MMPSASTSRAAAVTTYAASSSRSTSGTPVGVGQGRDVVHPERRRGRGELVGA